MARVITPAGLDLGDVQDETLLAYYRGEQYTFPEDDELASTTKFGIDIPVMDEQLGDFNLNEAVAADVAANQQPPADEAGPVVDGAVSDAVAAPEALPADGTV